MSFKSHLIIVSILILAALIAAKFIFAPKQEEIVTPQKISPYTIIINRASWGLNCRTEKSADNNYMGSNTNRIKENNVLSAVSSICNARSECQIPVDVSALGEDPDPRCGYKEFYVEYRCFSLDRLREIKSTDTVIGINCDSEIPVTSQ